MNIRFLQTILLLAGLVGWLAPLTAQEEEQLVPDAKLRKALKAALGVSSKLTKADLQRPDFTAFYFPYATDPDDNNLNYRVQNLAGLGECIHLKYLDLSGHALENMSEISKLANLEWLQLRNNNIRNKDGPGQIEYENNDPNQPRDWDELSLGMLRYLPKLKTLDLSNNRIGHLGLFAEMKQLENLYLGRNRYVEDDGNPETLDPVYYPSDLTPLGQLSNLQRLYLDNLQISNIDVLHSLKNLVELSLAGNYLTEFPDLVKNVNDPEDDLWTSLMYLNLRDNYLRDLTDNPAKNSKSLNTIIKEIANSEKHNRLNIILLEKNYYNDVDFAKSEYTDLKNFSAKKSLIFSSPAYGNQNNIWTDDKHSQYITRNIYYISWMGTIDTTSYPYVSVSHKGWIYIPPVYIPQGFYFIRYTDNSTPLTWYYSSTDWFAEDEGYLWVYNFRTSGWEKWFPDRFVTP